MESNSSSNPLEKAAAQAWYKHTTGGTPPPSPSASSHLLVSSAAASPKKTPPSSSPAITLLDVYEIDWITTQLERLISSSSSSSSSASVSGVEFGDRRRMGRKNSWRKGFGRHATSLCGSFREAVMEATSNNRAKTKRGDIGFRTGC